MQMYFQANETFETESSFFINRSDVFLFLKCKNFETWDCLDAIFYEDKMYKFKDIIWI